MTILVTGGAGFIGGNFVLDWLEQYDELVINLDKLTYAGNLYTLYKLNSDPRHIFVQGDIKDELLLNRLLNTYQPRAVIHFAAETHVDRAIHSPLVFVETNVRGTFNLLESLRVYWQSLPKAAQQCFRFVHISTDEVYGSLNQSAPPFTEHHRYAPNNPYAASKASADHLVRAWYQTYGLPIIITNCSNNYGPFHFPEKLIPSIIVKALAKQPLAIYGNGQHCRDWLYVKDHCAALRCVLDKGRVGEHYNIGGGTEKTNVEVVQILCQLLDTLKPKADGNSYAEQITFVADRPGHDQRYAMNIAKIRQELNWAPVESFEEGLKKTIAWYLNNPDWIKLVTQKISQQ